MKQPRVFTIIPAAGLSKRMGQPKQLLKFGSSTVLQSVIETVLDGGIDGLMVVTNRAVADAINIEEDPRYLTAILENIEAEMLDSILLGVDHLAKKFKPSESDAFMVCPGDVPGVTSDLVRTCADAYRNDPNSIVVAAHDKKPGHPIVVPFEMVEEIRRLKNTGLRGILEIKSECVRYVEARSAATQHDLDTPDDYRQLIDQADDETGQW